MLEGRPSDEPTVVTAFVMASLLNRLKMSTDGSNLVEPYVNAFMIRRSTRFCHGYRYTPRSTACTFCVTCVSPGTVVVVTTKIRCCGRPLASRIDSDNRKCRRREGVQPA